MLLLLLKYQFRSGFFITLIVTFFASLLESYFLYNISLIVFLFNQKLFFSIYSNLFISIIHIRISDIKVSKVLLLHNLSILFWLNLWYLLGKLFASFFFHLTLSTDFIYYITFNCCAVFSFIIGNYISNSDVVTYKVRFMQSFASRSVFTSSLLFFAFAVFFFSICCNKLIFISVLLFFLIVIWYWCLKSYENLTYYKFLTRSND